MDWKPIETAPEPWERALVWSSHWAEPHISDKRDNTGSFWLGDWDYMVLGATHWMPLPDAPDATRPDIQPGIGEGQGSSPDGDTHREAVTPVVARPAKRMTRKEPPNLGPAGTVC